MHFEYTRIRADLEKHLHSRYETTSSRPLNVYKTGSLQSTYNVGSTKPENPTRKLDLEWSETLVFGAEQLSGVRVVKVHESWIFNTIYCLLESKQYAYWQQ